MHSPLTDLIQGHTSHLVIQGSLPASPCVACCGSFNPLHPGHLNLLKLGQAISALPGVFELSVTNVDKPPLDPPEIDRRSRQFTNLHHPLVLTNQPRYLGKLSIFPPGSSFVMGADTFLRLVDLRYYHPSESPLDVFESARTGFIVAPRRLADGNILTPQQILHQSPDSARWTRLTTLIHPDQFLMDISSSQIRSAGSTAPNPLISTEDGK
jgi:hypothetical protein